MLHQGDLIYQGHRGDLLERGACRLRSKSEWTLLAEGQIESVGVTSQDTSHAQPLGSRTELLGLRNRGSPVWNWSGCKEVGMGFLEGSREMCSHISFRF